MTTEVEDTRPKARVLNNGADWAMEETPADTKAVKALKAEWRTIAADERAEVARRDAAQRTVNVWQGRLYSSERQIERLQRDRLKIETALEALRR